MLHQQHPVPFASLVRMYCVITRGDYLECRTRYLRSQSVSKKASLVLCQLFAATTQLTEWLKMSMDTLFGSRTSTVQISHYCGPFVHASTRRTTRRWTWSEHELGVIPSTRSFQCTSVIESELWSVHIRITSIITQYQIHPRCVLMPKSWFCYVCALSWHERLRVIIWSAELFVLVAIYLVNHDQLAA